MNQKNLFIAVGFFAGAVMLYNAYQRRRKDVPIYFRKSLSVNYNARTIPPFGIFIKESERDNEALIEHEKIHWKQFQEKGLLGFYYQYAKEFKKYGYDKMPMEQDVRKNESDYCKENYTECVRTGEANTVHNADFRK